MTKGFRATTEHLDSLPIVVLADDRGQRARIALHGAALLSLELPFAAGVFNVAPGYKSAVEILARQGSYFAILAPFGGRIREARYRFDGVPHDLDPAAANGVRGFRHGFVRDADFDLAELVADSQSARTVLHTRIAPQLGYPFCIDLNLEFVLDANGLSLSAHMHNAGDTAAPCFFGWHAYFRMGEGLLDDWSLTIPAHSTMRTGDDLIAVPGQAAYAALDQNPALDFRQPQTIGARQLDNSYVGLKQANDGLLYTRLANPATGVGIEVWQERGVMHAFTGDTLGERARMALALEPMECMADAFNRPEWLQAIRLEPGATRTFRCGVRRARA
ncbi:MAG TPA: aldose epimerase [Chiayiivirga sp.]|nr:aldose epimerase [Chiayiivirga sp.]